MKRCNRFDQAEAKSVSRRAAAAFQPIKRLKHTSAIRDRNSRPAIDYGNSYRAWRGSGRKSDGCSRRGMFHRVLDYVCDHLRQELAVSPDREPACDIGRETLLFLLGHRLVDLDQRAQQLREIDLGKMTRRPSARDLRDA